MKTIHFNLKYLLIGILCICFVACTNDSDEPNPVVENEISRSTISIVEKVTLNAPGTLQETLEEAMAGKDVSTLQKLTIIGLYNGKDVQYWKTNLVNLIEFDLKEAIPTYTEGQDEYLDPYENTMYQNDNVIGPHSFSFMDKLETIVFPDCITAIEYEAFNGCVNLNCPIIIPSTITSLGDGIFNDCIELKDVKLYASIERIPSTMFRGCTKLESIELSNSIKTVGWATFENCKSLNNYNPFINIEHIENYCFQYSGLEEVDLSKISDFSYAHRAFAYSENLKKVILPENVTTLYNELFKGCTSLKDINIPSTLEVFNDQLFSGCGFTEFTIPTNIKKIGREVFDANKFLTKVILNEGLESIDYCAFRGVPITEISIPSTVTELAYGAFESTQLKEITIPETVTTVGGTLFNYCHALAAIIWNSPADVADVFDLNPNCYLFLDNDKISVAPNWKNVVVRIGEDYVAESIILCEGGQRDNANMSYGVPKEIKVKKITYERRFGDYDWQGEYWTHPGQCSGWQTIVLPFTPTKIEHETKGEVAPFNSGIEGAKPFWLRELTAEGFVDKIVMEPNKPYIIAMPNHDSYMDEYRLYGKIIFSAENVTLSATTDGTSEVVYPASVGPEYDLQPTYQFVGKGLSVYALNTTYGIDGHNYGSVFARSSSDIYAFEAYVSTGGRLARSTFGIDTSSSNTRSAKEKNTTGIPQIGDM